MMPSTVPAAPSPCAWHSLHVTPILEGVEHCNISCAKCHLYPGASAAQLLGASTVDVSLLARRGGAGPYHQVKQQLARAVRCDLGPLQLQLPIHGHPLPQPFPATEAALWVALMIQVK